jgi:hypothetical protein
MKTPPIVRGPLVFGLLAASACAARPPAQSARPFDRDAATADVVRALDDFHDAAARADEPRYFAHFAPDGVFLGTDASKRWEVAAFRAYAHPHFSRGKGWTYHPLRRAIAFASDGSVAWFDEDLRGDRVGPSRGTGVLVCIEGRWLIVLYDLSITVPNERFDAVRTAIDGSK